MARRRLVIKRIDPWSVLKFGAVANVILLAIVLLVAGVVWYIVDRLQLVDQACAIAADVGFTSCGVNAGNLFQALALLGALWTVVQTAVLVFFAFLHNLIADLTGGIAIGVAEDGGPRTETWRSSSAGATTGARPRPQQTSERNGAPSGATARQTAARPASQGTDDTLFGDQR